MKKKNKSYQQYKDEMEKREQSIMAKYGAPPEAKPPIEYRNDPKEFDAQFRRMAFTKRRTLEGWNKNERNG